MSERNWCPRCRGLMTQYPDDNYCCGGHAIVPTHPSFQAALDRMRLEELERLAASHQVTPSVRAAAKAAAEEKRNPFLEARLICLGRRPDLHPGTWQKKD